MCAGVIRISSALDGAGFLLFFDVVDNIVCISLCHGRLDQLSGCVNSFSDYFKH